MIIVNCSGIKFNSFFVDHSADSFSLKSVLKNETNIFVTFHSFFSNICIKLNYRMILIKTVALQKNAWFLLTTRPSPMCQCWIHSSGHSKLLIVKDLSTPTDCKWNNWSNLKKHYKRLANLLWTTKEFNSQFSRNWIPQTSSTLFPRPQ